MEISVQRDLYRQQDTMGRMFLIGKFFCFTMEPRFDRSQGKPYAIPAGRYRVTLENSPRFRCRLPLLHNVPNFEAVEIHIGNKPADTHGCTLVAEQRSPDLLMNSRLAFDRLIQTLSALPPNEEIWVTYEDAAGVAASGTAGVSA